MNIKLIFQKDGNNTLNESITSSFERNPKKVYFFCSTLKENGFRMIEENFIDSKAKLYFAIGIDKKNTTRNMLENLLTYTKDIHYYSNNQLVEFDSNIIIFEYDKEVVIYVSNSDLSESGLNENIAIYSEYIYSLENKEEKAQYKELIKKLLGDIEISEFKKIDKAEIEKLVDEKEIFTTRQYNHNVKSIAELLGKTNENKEEKVEVEKETDDSYIGDAVIPKIDLSNDNIDIEFDDIDLSGFNEEVEIKPESTGINIDVEEKKNEEKKQAKKIKKDDSYEKEENFSNEVDTNNDMYDEDLANVEFDENDTLDIDNMLFSKADIKLNVGGRKTKKKEADKKSDKSDKVILEENDTKEDEVNEFAEEELVQAKKINLNNVSNFIFESPAKALKGQDINNIKIPNYIKNMIPEFFEINDNGKNVEINGVSYRKRDIKIEIVDVKNGTKYTDREAKMLLKNGQTYITISSDTLKNIDYNEDDIVRIIKLSSDIYHIEFVSKELQEYKLWNKLCTQKFKASDRKYGMM